MNVSISPLSQAKWLIYTLLGWMTFGSSKERTCVLVLSSMRSGSTLLKSMLGQAADVSLLDEFNFITYAKHNRYFFHWLMSRLSDRRIVVLKKPFNNVPQDKALYGLVPLPGVLRIVLHRNPYEMLLSLKAMQRKYGYRVFGDQECVDYWCDTYEAIFNNTDTTRDTLGVCYEELTRRPAEVTQSIFRFIGSTHKSGVERYGAHDWKKGRDDDSDKIRSGSVHEASSADPSTDPGLYAAIQASARIALLQKRLEGLQKG
jgi:hypothetical protein